MAYPIPEKADKTKDPVLFERQELGDCLRTHFPHSGWCTRCGIPWAHFHRISEDTHTTNYCVAEVGGTCTASLRVFDENGVVVPGTDAHPDIELHAGCFPMCQWCWERCTIEERVRYHEILIDYTDSFGHGTEEERRQHRAAIIYSIRLGR